MRGSGAPATAGGLRRYVLGANRRIVSWHPRWTELSPLICYAKTDPTNISTNIYGGEQS